MYCRLILDLFLDTNKIFFQQACKTLEVELACLEHAPVWFSYFFFIKLWARNIIYSLTSLLTPPSPSHLPDSSLLPTWRREAGTVQWAWRRRQVIRRHLSSTCTSGAAVVGARTHTHTHTEIILRLPLISYSLNDIHDIHLQDVYSVFRRQSYD